MKLNQFLAQYSLPGDNERFNAFLDAKGNVPGVYRGFMGGITVEDASAGAVATEYKAYLEAREKNALLEQERAAEAQRQAAEEKQQHDRAIASMLITSGFNFDGYTIKKYSGYISGDDVEQIPKEKSFWTGSNKTDVGESLSKALVKIRRQALKELKEAAYDLGCNAVIGVDFDYITLDPEVHNGFGTQQHTEDLPYVFCVTANGNAVIIEKNKE